MEISLLRAYLDLAGTCHFARSSERLHLSPSTLSRMIQRIEQQAGARLFERNNRQVSLTRAGESFHRYAVSTLQAWEALQVELHTRGSRVQGEVSLYCSVTASHRLLDSLVSRLRLRHPELELKLHTGDQAQSLQRLLAGEEDTVIAARPQDLPAGVEFQLLARSRLVFITARQSAQNTAGYHASVASPAYFDWARTPLILAESGLARRHVQAWLRQHKIRADIYAQVSGHEAIVSMVALGCGVAAVPELVLDASPVRDSIQSLDNWPALPDFEIGLCTLSNRLREPMIEAVWNAARD